MIDYNYHRRSRLRLAIFAMLSALFFSWLLYLSATASTTMLLRLWHDQDASGTVSAGDTPAVGVAVTVVEQCTGNVCAASPLAFVVVTDANGYANLELQPGTSYSIEAPCMVMSVQVSDASGQAAQEVTTCGQWRLWLPAVANN